MRASISRWLGGIALAAVNMSVIALVAWLVYHPFSYSDRAGRPDYSSLVFLVYPAINLVALCGATRSPGSRFVSSAYYLNVTLAVLAGVVAIGSCAESIYSGPEKVLTAITLTPPLVSALALRPFRDA